MHTELKCMQLFFCNTNNSLYLVSVVKHSNKIKITNKKKMCDLHTHLYLPEKNNVKSTSFITFFCCGCTWT